MLAKTKLNNIEVLRPTTLGDLNISHHKFVPVNNVLTVYDEIKEEIFLMWWEKYIFFTSIIKSLKKL